MIFAYSTRTLYYYDRDEYDQALKKNDPLSEGNVVSMWTAKRGDSLTLSLVTQYKEVPGDNSALPNIYGFEVIARNFDDPGSGQVLIYSDSSNNTNKYTVFDFPISSQHLDDLLGIGTSNVKERVMLSVEVVIFTSIGSAKTINQIILNVLNDISGESGGESGGGTTGPAGVNKLGLVKTTANSAVSINSAGALDIKLRDYSALEKDDNGDLTIALHDQGGLAVSLDNRLHIQTATNGGVYVDETNKLRLSLREGGGLAVDSEGRLYVVGGGGSTADVLTYTSPDGNGDTSMHQQSMYLRPEMLSSTPIKLRSITLHAVWSSDGDGDYVYDQPLSLYDINTGALLATAISVEYIRDLTEVGVPVYKSTFEDVAISGPVRLGVIGLNTLEGGGLGGEDKLTAPVIGGDSLDGYYDAVYCEIEYIAQGGVSHQFSDDFLVEGNTVAINWSKAPDATTEAPGKVRLATSMDDATGVPTAAQAKAYADSATPYATTSTPGKVTYAANINSFDNGVVKAYQLVNYLASDTLTAGVGKRGMVTLASSTSQLGGVVPTMTLVREYVDGKVSGGGDIPMAGIGTPGKVSLAASISPTETGVPTSAQVYAYGQSLNTGGGGGSTDEVLTYTSPGSDGDMNREGTLIFLRPSLLSPNVVRLRSITINATWEPNSGGSGDPSVPLSLYDVDTGALLATAISTEYVRDLPNEGVPLYKSTFADIALTGPVRIGSEGYYLTGGALSKGNDETTPIIGGDNLADVYYMMYSEIEYLEGTGESGGGGGGGGGVTTLTYRGNAPFAEAFAAMGLTAGKWMITINAVLTDGAHPGDYIHPFNHDSLPLVPTVEGGAYCQLVGGTGTTARYVSGDTYEPYTTCQATSMPTWGGLYFMGGPNIGLECQLFNWDLTIIAHLPETTYDILHYDNYDGGYTYRLTAVKLG